MSSNVTFKGIALGDYCNAVDLSYERSPRIVELPRTNGVRIYNQGGGLQTITISGWVKKTTVQAAQDYLDSLEVALGNSSGTLIANGITYTSCFLTNFSFDSEDSFYRTFSCTFVKSAY